MVPYALGQNVKFTDNMGPTLKNSTNKLLNNNKKGKKLSPIYGYRNVRKNLDKKKSLISFIGAPWFTSLYVEY